MRDERKKVEMAFAPMKKIPELDRLRLRGLSGARAEVLPSAMAQKLRKLARDMSRPPPTQPLSHIIIHQIGSQDAVFHYMVDQILGITVFKRSAT